MSMGNILLEKEILLESGTNECEILVFRVGEFMLGINVAKVREVLPTQTITRIPQTHTSILGCFTLRKNVVSCVSLHLHLGEPAPSGDVSTVIVTEFNRVQTAFVVDAVEKIHRVSWQNVMAVPKMVVSAASPVTAITEIDGRLVTMLDFETISDQVTDRREQTDAVPNPHNVPREAMKVLLADDSPTVRSTARATLNASGYTNVQVFENGEEVWDWIVARYQATGDVRQVADLLISDVEMPRVDGFHLTKNIKDHAELRRLPVMLFSSILTPDNEKKGKVVRADAQITKPELHRVVELADTLILQSESVSV